MSKTTTAAPSRRRARRRSPSSPRKPSPNPLPQGEGDWAQSRRHNDVLSLRERRGPVRHWEAITPRPKLLEAVDCASIIDMPPTLHQLARGLQTMIEKRDQVTVEIGMVEVRRAQLCADLTNIDEAIRTLEKEMIGLTFTRQVIGVPRAAKNGEISRVILDCLRESDEPMTTRSLFDSLITEWGLDAQDRKACKIMFKRLRSSLKYQRGQGVLQSIPLASGVLGWELA